MLMYIGINNFKLDLKILHINFGVHTTGYCIFSFAERRLISTTQKLKSMKKFEDYDKLFCEWEEEGIISKVPNEALKISGHYLPYHPVIKPNNQITTIRPVFDASCKVGRAPSLNDCLRDLTS